MSHNSRWLFLAAASILIFAASAAHAAPDTASDATAESASDTTELAEITITGTRLKSAVTPTPVTTVNAAVIENAAVANVADLVNELPSFRPSLTPSQNQRIFGGGGNELDLRGLGTVRTLVLVDGQRVTPTTTIGTIDTNMIPTSLIDRIDVVTGGASAAYGSDAVAGVVNFVLKKDIQGIQGNAQWGESQLGDSREPKLSFAAGTSFDGNRGHLMFGVDATENSGVGSIYSRSWGRMQPGLIAYGADRPAGTPAEGFNENVVYSAQAAGGLITAGPLKGVAFGAGGTPYNFNYGTVYSNLMIGGSNPGLNPFGNWSLEIPTKTYTSLGRASFDITPTTQVYAEVNYAFTEGNGFDTFQQNSFKIASGNPFIPAAIQSQMTADDLSSITVGRVLTETGGLLQHDTYRTTGGRLGITGAIFSDWTWDASIQSGTTRLYAGVTGPTNKANYAAAVDAVMGPNGVPICGPVATNPNLSAAQRLLVQAGCVPFDIFGKGSPSAASLAYISGTATSEIALDQAEANANLRGSPFSTWAGKVQTAAGVEWRSESVSAVADPIGQEVGWSTDNNGTYAGKEHVTEGYAEAEVPLATDVFMAKSFGLNAAVRETDYSISGSATTWKVGLTYEPVSDVRLRATRSRDIRAPNLSELYGSSGSGISNASVVNPINGQTGALNSSASGNTALTPEKADTTTFGVAFQPGWIPGLAASIDVYRIDIHQVITSLTAIQVLNFCAAGQKSYCSAITFDQSQFGIANIATEPYNLNSLSEHGFDLEFDYALPTLPFSIPGGVNLRALGTHVSQLSTTSLGTVVDRAGSLQGGGLPSWTWYFNAIYTLDRFALNFDARYVSASIYDATLIGPGEAGYSPTLPNSIADNKFPSATYFNMGASYDLSSNANKKFTVYGRVENLLNTPPPNYAAVGIGFGGDPYDLIGRVFKVGFRCAY